MARIRTIKPEFWTDERVGECSVSARLLLIASLNFADDHGGLDRSSKQLKAQAFPYDDIDCEPLVAELLGVGLFVEYESAGRKYLHIKGFRKHQRVEKPAKPRIPLYDSSVNTPILLTDSSPTPHLGVTVSSSEGKGREGKGSKTPIPQASAPESPPVAQAEPAGAFEIETEAERQTPNPVERIFNHWRDIHRHPQARLDDKRRKVIRAALKNYDEPELCEAISGYLNSPHHMGQNETGTVYDALELMLRDAQHIDAGLRFHAEPPRSDLSAQTRRIISATENWTPPEMRHAGG